LSISPPFGKDGIYVVDRTLHVIGPRYIAMVASALASETRTKLLEYISKKPADLEEIARAIGQSKANVSSQIRKLEAVNIVKARYVPGQRGIKKVVELNVDRVLFHIVVGGQEG
jgi:predicted transcriptional regulator